MRYVCGAQKEDISGYAMLHKVRRDRCSLVIYHTRISLSATFQSTISQLIKAAHKSLVKARKEAKREILVW